MISKAEFLDKVKKEVFPTLDETKIPKYKLLAGLLAILLVCVLFGYIFYASEEGFSENKFDWIAILFLLCCIVPATFYTCFFQTNIEKTKSKLYKILDMPQLNIYGKNRDLWFQQMRATKLFNNDLDLYPLFFKDTNIVFDKLNAVVWEGKMNIAYTRYSERDELFQGIDVFCGLLVEVKTEHFYKEPIVFVKKEKSNGRKELKKVQLHYQDSYFELFSNDTATAQNLNFQEITSKLLRVDEKIFNFSKIEASFFEDKLYIALYTKNNLFEPIQKRFKDIHQYELFYDEIVAIEKYCAQFKDL